MADIADIIRQAAAKYGVSPEYLIRAAQIESRMNPMAANPASSARGLFQFINPTWKQYGNGADPLDPVANADAAARFTLDNTAALRKGIGREPTPAELYLAHQQGARGATNILANPGRPAAELVGEDAVRLNGGVPGMSAGDFAAKWTGKFGGGGGVPPMPAAPGDVPVAAGDALAVPPDLAAAPAAGMGLGSIMASALVPAPAAAPLPEDPKARPKPPKKPSLAAILGDSGNLVLSA